MPTGLAIVGVSERVMHNVQERTGRIYGKSGGCGYWDFATMAEANSAGYFLTPQR